MSSIDWLGLHREYLMAGEMEIIAGMLCNIEARGMIEIGCRDGRTARVLLHNVPSLDWYIGIDVPMSYAPTLPLQRGETVSRPGALAMDDPRFEVIISERGSLDLGPPDLPFCDAIFIDGDHSEQAVVHDSELARMIMRPNGLIIWHDAGNPSVEVTGVLNRLRKRGWPIETVPNTWLAFCRH